MAATTDVQGIADALLPLSRVLVASHYNPDADAYGSSLALCRGLVALGKEAICINESGRLPRFSFMPGMSNLVADIPAAPFDAVIACDCGDAKRLGERLKLPLMNLSKLINIDHHKSNDNFGAINWVQSSASSTSEMIYNLLRVLEGKCGHTLIDADTAQLLFAGISSDTGSFRYASTVASTFEAAKELLARGAKPAVISEALYEKNSIAATLLQAEALAALKLHAEGRLCQIVVPAELLKKHHGTADDTEELVERGRAIDGVRVSLMMRQEESQWKVSMRAKGGCVDLSQVARQFGGGGHAAAAGFTWRRGFEELESRLLGLLIEEVRK